jgi:hypothetical protein
VGGPDGIHAPSYVNKGNVGCVRLVVVGPLKDFFLCLEKRVGERGIELLLDGTKLKAFRAVANDIPIELSAHSSSRWTG